ncbi:MAG TPA: hypothetical protein VEX57_01320 [Microlunatus sp.]|nr:hypothetical protein [Microlunatus sp.]
MSGNNPFGNQPGQPDPRQPQGQPNQGQPYPGQPTPPGQPYGGPGYSGPAYGQPTPSGPYPPYGQGGPPGPGGPQGPGGPGGPGGPQQPYGAYNPGGQPPKKSKAVPIIIGAVVLALVVAAIGVGVALSRGGEEPVAGGGTGGTTSAPPAEAKKASDAVQGYLEALAAGDAQAALAFASTAPTDTTFLTNEVLAASNKTAAISAINVPEVDDEYAYRVAASFSMGKQAINTDFSVEKDGDAWKLRDVAADLDLQSKRAKTLPMLINGVNVETDKVLLFPGSYTFTSGNKNVDYGKSSTLIVKSPSEYPDGLSDIQPTLTSAGDKAFTNAVEDSVKKCMKSKDLKNPGCPNNVTKVTGSVKPKEGTFEWSYDKDALDNLKVRLDYDNPAVAEAFVYLSMKAEGDCGDSRCRITPTTSPKPAVNMTQTPLKVVWKR